MSLINEQSLGMDRRVREVFTEQNQNMIFLNHATSEQCDFYRLNIFGKTNVYLKWYLTEVVEIVN